ncbi:hypothetical protein PDJAM_G00173750 [Pangasius djambal]|uniref:Uncharacterized protein n=1 Tax=Pangasius djambal TaxID=1691987 RepID=A0ACC5ZN38_9TELE|nr:hypothetical protein [Pangasius djambal]
MELCLYKGLLVVLLLHLCQGQDPALPSPSPESALPSLVDVMDAVKAAFMEAVKISKDDAARAVFEQVVEDLGPQENIAEKPPATADDTEDELPAVVHEHADKETTTTSLSEENAKQEQADPKLNSSEQTLVLPDEEEVRQGAGLGQELGKKAVELIYQLNKSAEESVQEVEDSVPNLARDLVESTQEPKESFELKSEDKSPSDQKDAELDESQIWSFESAPEGERVEQAGVEEGKQEPAESELVKVQEQTHSTDGIGEMEKEDGWKKDVEAHIESKIQKGGLFELAKQTEPHPDQDQEHGLLTDDDLKVRIVVEEKQNEDEQKLVDVGGHVVEVKPEKEDVEEEATAHIGNEAVGGEAEVESLIPVSQATDETSQELATDVMQETNDLNDIVTSRDPELNWDVPTLGISGHALPPFPTLGIDLGESDELVEEPADKTQSTTPKQEAWKIGVIAIAFFLILQTLVTVTYILKCKGKRNSCAVPDRVCEDGIGAVEHDAANADADEQTTVDDLPERSEIQQETFNMTPIHTQSMVEKSFNQ